MSWPINAIHAVLTPDGKVLSYGTDPNGLQGAQLYYDVWSPATNAHSLVQHSTRTDMFCSAQSVLPESGQVLIVGGDSRGGPSGSPINFGVPEVNLFDPFALTMTAAPRMASARWYGSSVPLANGRVLVLGGIDGTGASITTPEIYTPDGGWKELPGIAWPSDILYPRAALAPNGRVIVASDNRLFSIDTEAASVSQIGTLPRYIDWLMPWALFDRGKMLLVADDGGAMVIDVNGSTPAVTSFAGPGVNRNWGSATVLPDGKVLVTGGSAQANELVDTALGTSLWDPQTGVWTVGAAAQKPRLYHSTALLLPDATVLSAGGGSPGPVVNLNAEIYSPPYLFDSSGARAARPMINTAPAQLSLGANFRVSVASSRPIQRVTLVRTGSVTHSTNFEQRFLELPFAQAAGDSNVDITLNESPNVLPVGHYMLFVIDSAGVPSIAKIVKLGAGWSQVAEQGQSFTLDAPTVVRWGAGESAVDKTVSGPVRCSSDFFGTNPAPTVMKACWVLAPKAAGVVLGTQPPAADQTLATEGGSFSMPAASVVSYGAGLRWVEKAVTGTATCGNAFFGTDPAPFVLKSCVTAAS